MEIQRDITIEDLSTKFPFSVKYLAKKGIRCLACGEPIWGTLESAAKEKGFSNDDLELFVKELNELSKTEKQDTSTNDKIDIKKYN